MESPSLLEKSERAVLAALCYGAERKTGTTLAVPTCPVCGTPLEGGQRFACADRCRAAKSWRKREDDLIVLKEQLTQALMWVRALGGSWTAA